MYSVESIKKYLIYKARNGKYNYYKPDDREVHGYGEILNYVANYELENPTKIIEDKDINSAWKKMKEHHRKNRPNNSHIVENW